ncbi:MAG: glycosyltransferase family 2 protein [Prevotella sp.]|nr:glycosyltransferase family 2 protein [Prevotella sp.]
MKHQLSILLPVYNVDCRQLVAELSRQAQALSDVLSYEIIVADDGSTDRSLAELCREVSQHPCCRYVERNENVGRAAIRNFLARQARYDWLLFLDSDVTVASPHFISTYLDAQHHATTAIVDGGIAIAPSDTLERCNLRYRYEVHEQPRHTAAQRSQHPYRAFRTTNFMVRRDAMLQIPFDERIRTYGFEDVLFGKQMHQHGQQIHHIDNPVMLTDIEPNDIFLRKTEQSLLTLHQFRADLRGYSRLLTFADGLHSPLLRSAFLVWHRLFRGLERRNLQGTRPSLRLFKLYKIGYFLSLK